VTTLSIAGGRATTDPTVESLLRLGDDRLVLGHRLSEWCGHAPILEEDIALGNIALDLLGQAQGLLKLAGALEGRGRDEDALAFFRDAHEFRNVQLVELPRGDFAHTMVRQFLFDAYDVFLTARLSASPNADLAGIMAKAHKEARYHVRHRRAQGALDALWPYAAELFATDAVDTAAVDAGFGADVAALRGEWQAHVADVIAESSLRLPLGLTCAPAPGGGRVGRHTEHLEPLLAEMQVVARAHPGAGW